MNLGVFIDLVEEMRTAQRNFFELHQYSWLQKAKKLERRVDDIISVYRDELKKQAGVQLDLFD